MSIDRSDETVGGGTFRSLHILTAVLAVWLFISPWVLAYGTGDAWNTWIVSAIIFLIALSALSRPTARHETANLILGIWMFISPWVLAFSHPSVGASWNQWLCGAAVFLLSGACLLIRRNPALADMHHGHAHMAR